VKPKRQVDQDLLELIRQMPCVVCDAPPLSEPSHIKSRGSGGPDTAWNVFPKCRPCHSDWHQKGRMTFLKEHPEFARLLFFYGWGEINGRLYFKNITWLK